MVVNSFETDIARCLETRGNWMRHHLTRLHAIHETKSSHVGVLDSQKKLFFMRGRRKQMSIHLTTHQLLYAVALREAVFERGPATFEGRDIREEVHTLLGKVSEDWTITHDEQGQLWTWKYENDPPAFEPETAIWAEAVTLAQDRIPES
jgi:hypothetical protein